MITVLILDMPDPIFEPILDKSKSMSFLPISLSNNLLGISFSWINSYFSLDKIFVVCTGEEQEDVKIFCRGIYEENIIIEPKKINFSVSVFYATLFLGKIFPDETVFFIPVSFLFHENFKFGNFLFAVDEMVEKEWIVIPSVLLNKEEKETEYIDAGKQITNIKGIDFFHVENIIYNEEIKKRKMFGKYGKVLKIIAGKHNSILKSFLLDERKEYFIKNLNEYFKKGDIQWDQLNEEYNKNSATLNAYNYFTGNKNFVTLFIESRPYFFNNWQTVLEKFSSRKDGNLICGKVQLDNCKAVICLNYDDDNIQLYDLNNMLVVKKKGEMVVKNIQPD